MRARRFAALRHRAVSEALESRLLLASSANLVADIIAGAESSVAFSVTSRNSVAVGSKLFFTAVDGDNGMQVFVSDGTTAGTRRLKPGSLDARSNGGPYDFVSFNGLAYFTANDGNDQQIWRSDGTDDGTVKVSSVPAGSGSPVFSTVVNGGIVFFTNPNDANTAFWRLNPAGGQSKIGSFGGVPYAVAGSKVFIHGTVAHPGVWVSDGSSAQNLNTELDSTYEGASLGSLAFFNGSVVGTFSEPWVSDGTPGGTRILADVVNNGSSSPLDFTTSGSLVYFVAYTGTDYQIYSTSGSGVTKVTSLAGTSTSSSIRDLTDFNGTLYFTYGPGSRNLYKLAGGTTPTLVGTAQGGPEGGTNPGFLTAAGSTLYFSALDTAGKARLFESDGSTIAAVTGDPGADPTGLTNANGLLYFAADDDAHGNELHATNGGVTPPPTDFTVKLKADKINLDEGGSVVFTTIVDGPVGQKYQYRWDFDGNGTLVKDGYKPTHKYGDNLKDNVPRNVRVKVIAPDGSFKNAYLNVTVHNVKPTVKATFMAATVTYAPTPFTIFVDDPGESDEVTVTIDWGDGTVESYAPIKQGYVSGVHIFTTRMLLGRDVKITARDQDGGKNEKKRTVIVDSVIPNDPKDAVIQALGVFGAFVGGTSGNDRIEIRPDPVQPDPDADQLLVYLDGAVDVITLDFENMHPDAHRLNVFAGDGDDIIIIDPGIRARVKVSLSGGNGRDTLDGGSGNDTLDGGGSNDKLNGRAGKDLLKGGKGNDRMSGDGGHDILDAGVGNDTLRGGSGNDLLKGGDGTDLLDDLIGDNTLLA